MCGKAVQIRRESKVSALKMKKMIMSPIAPITTAATILPINLSGFVRVILHPIAPSLIFEVLHLVDVAATKTNPKFIVY